MLPTTSSTTPAAQASRPSPGAGPRLGFTDQRSEIEIDALPVRGEIPSWLTGSLLRNGPAQWDLTEGSVNHWFDGMAMLHRFAIVDGQVGYRNKLVRGRAAEAFERDGRLAFHEFATDPCKTTFGRVMSMFDPNITDNGAVNISQVAGKWLAITESPMAVEFDPRTLETVGVHQRAAGMRVPLAHEHVDHDTHELWGLRTQFGGRSHYELTATDPETGHERLVAKLAAKRPSYQHSFGLTDRYAIVSEHPFVVNPIRIPFSGKPFIENFRWEPERGVIFTAIDRRTGKVAGRWSGAANFCFHHVNAWDEDDGGIVVDFCAFPDAEIVDALALGARRSGAPAPDATLCRVRLVPGEDAAREVPMGAAPLELPRIDDRRKRKPYRYVWGVGSGGPAAEFLDRLRVIDVDEGRVAEWHEPGTFPGEPVFVRRPGGTDEGDGVVLSVVLEPGRGGSSLLVLDARTLTEVARAEVPQHVPFGFHGGFVRGLI